MDIADATATNAVITEIKLYMTQQLHSKGFLSDDVCARAKEIILKEAKQTEKSGVKSCDMLPK